MSIPVGGHQLIAQNQINTNTNTNSTTTTTAHQTFQQYSSKFVKNRKINDNLTRKLGYLTDSLNGN